MSDRDGGLDKLQGIAMMLYAARESYQIEKGVLEAFAVNKVTTRRRPLNRKRKSATAEDFTDDEDIDEDAHISDSEEHLIKRQKSVECQA